MICYKCKLHKPDLMFSKNPTKSNGFNNLCKLCKNLYNKQWYKVNKDRHKKMVSTYKKTYKSEIRNAVNKLKSAPCTDCHKSYPPYVMDFDHLHSKVKNIASMVSARTDLTIITQEIAKCELVCANCHRIRTYASRAGRSTGSSKSSLPGSTPG